MVNSDIHDLETTSNYIWNLSEPEALGGEGGYYLTVFCSAIEFIKNFDASSSASTSPPSPRTLPAEMTSASQSEDHTTLS